MEPSSIQCPHRIVANGQPVCEIVQQIVGLPLAQCVVNDSACAHCLSLPIAPQTPNSVTASMSIHAAKATGDQTMLREIITRMRPHLTKSPPAPPKTPEQVPCILRGKILRQVECKPCQANGQLMVDVFRCPKHTQCTINNTGLQPKIQGCTTCQERLPEAYQIETRPTPQVVLAAIKDRHHAQPAPAMPVPDRQP